jgi:LruC domain-containing protein
VKRHAVSVLLLALVAGPLAALPQLISGTGTAGDPYLLSSLDGNGKPEVLPDREVYSQAFSDEVVASLPEGQPLTQSRPKLLTEAVTRNLVVTEEADIQISFVHEGAGYRNVTGFFMFPTGSPPASAAEIQHIAAFPNSSYSGSGGGLLMGDTIDLGTVPAGTTIGFFLNANGWSSGNQISLPKWAVYSIDAFNPASDPNLQRQTILLRDPDGERFVVAFEDIRRDNAGCDQDFNDVILSVQATPNTAIEITGVAELVKPVDSDGDGVFDSQDDWPDDPEKAFKVSSQNLSLAFEDKWPVRGDYDFNDLVLSCAFEEARNAQNKVVELACTYEPVARGAGYRNALWLRFPELARSKVASVWRAVAGGEEVAWATRADQSRATVEVFADGHVALPGNPFANTQLGKNQVAGEVTVLRLRFSEPLDPAQLGAAPYDTFLKRGGHEVHLPGFAPSDTIDPSLIGTGDDDTRIGTSKTFQTQSGHPWAIVVPGTWKHPSERRSIDLGYWGFVPWAESGGANHADWYLYPQSNENVWFKTP